MKKSLALACLLPSLAAAAPAFEQASLRFFEQSDGPILPVARRIYTTRFDATRTRRLAVEVVGTYAAPDAAATVPLTCRLKKPDGSVAPAERPMEFEFFAGKTESRSANLLWGVAEDRDWQPGTYEVECLAADKPVAKATFDMVLNPPEVADGDIRVKALRIFPVADQLPPISARTVHERAAGRRARRASASSSSSRMRRSGTPRSCRWIAGSSGRTARPRRRSC